MKSEHKSFTELISKAEMDIFCKCQNVALLSVNGTNIYFRWWIFKQKTPFLLQWLYFVRLN